MSALQNLDSFGIDDSQLWEFIGLMLITNILSILATWVFIETIYLLLPKNRGVTWIPVPIVLGLSFLIGAFKGLTTGLFGLWLGAFPSWSDAVETRWIQTGILGLITLPLLSLALAKLSQINRKQQLLLMEQVDGILANRSGLGDNIQLRLANLKLEASRIVDNLEQALDKFPENGNQLFSKAVTSLLDEHIRPLSHTVWQEQQRRNKWLTLPTMIRAGILNSGPNPLFTALLFFLPLFLNALTTSDALEALFRAAVISTTTAVALAAYGRLPKSHPTIYLWGYFACVAAAISLSLWVGGMPLTEGVVIDFWLTVLVMTALAIQTLIFATLGFSLVSTEKQLDVEMAAIYPANQVSSKAKIVHAELVNRDYAQFLHSDVQNQLLISALAARESNFGPGDIQREISRVREVLATLETRSLNNVPLSHQEIADALRARWDGFIQLSIEIEPVLIAEQCLLGNTLIEVLNEAIANSVRHGLAQEVSIEIYSQPSGLNVTVMDDGIGPTAGKSGLGSKIVQEISAGNWSLKASESGGAKLEFRVSL